MSLFETANFCAAAVVLAVASMFVAGCENGSPEVADETPAPPGVLESNVKVDEVVKQLAYAYCGRAVSCCAEDELATVFGDGAIDEMSCRRNYERAAALGMVLTESIAADRIEFSAARAASCIQAIHNASCQDLSAHIASAGDPRAAVLGFPAFCDSPITPRADELEPGHQCLNDFECGSGSCAYGTAATVADEHAPVRLPGSCRPLPAGERAGAQARLCAGNH